MKKYSEVKIRHNTKLDPSTGKNNDCYEVTYKTPDGYGGQDSGGFSIETELFNEMKRIIHSEKTNTETI